MWAIVLSFKNYRHNYHTARFNHALLHTMVRNFYYALYTTQISLVVTNSVLLGNNRVSGNASKLPKQVNSTQVM